MALGNTWTTISSGSFSSGGATLTYYIEAKLNSQSIANNTSSISTRARTVFSGYFMSSYNVHMSCTGCTPYDGNNSTIYYFGTRTVLEGGVTVTHNADGTGRLNMSGACTGNLGMNIQLSGGVDLPTIPRASKPTYSTNPLTIGQTQTITTNRASSGFTHTLVISFGDYSETLTGVGASTTWTPTAAAIMQYMDTWQKTVTVTCTTYNGSTQIGSSTTSFTLQVDTSVYKPVITWGTATDTNATTSALETAGSFIKSYSNLQIQVTATPNNTTYGDIVEKLTVTLGNVSQQSTVGGLSVMVNFLANGITTATLTATATDSRGYSVTATKTLTLIDYSAIVIESVEVARVNQNGDPTETGEYVKYTIKGSAFLGSFGQVTNLIRVRTKSKLASAADYGSWVDEQTVTTSGSGFAQFTINGITVGTYLSSTQYDVIFRLEDALTGRQSLAVRVHEGIPVAAWGKDHFDVYGTFHIHDREDVLKFISLDPDSVEVIQTTFNGAVGGSVSWTVFKFGSFRVAVTKWRSASNYTVNQQWGSLYYTSNISTPDFPFSFSTIGYQDVKYVAADNNSTYTAFVMTAIQSASADGGVSGTNMGNFSLYRPDSGATIGHPVFTEIVIGTV